MDEKELVKLSQQGDEDAYGSLVHKYERKVFNLAFSMTRSRDLADDLAQEIFIKAYFSLNKFRFKSEFGTWLYRITVNHIKDHLRKRARSKQVPFEAVEHRVILHEDEAKKREDEQREEMRKKLVYKALETLPEKHQTILSLRDIRGLPYGEIAKILNISAGTVDSRLHRARKMLKKRLEPYIDSV